MKHGRNWQEGGSEHENPVAVAHQVGDRVGVAFLFVEGGTGGVEFGELDPVKETGVLVAQSHVAIVDRLNTIESVFFGRIEKLVQ